VATGPRPNTFAGHALAADTRVGFDAATWLAEALCKSGSPNGAALPAIERFREAATEKFAALPATRAQKAFTVVLVGYINTALLADRPAIYVVSNFEGLEGVRSEAALDNFNVESDVLDPSMGCLRAIGSATRANLDFRLLGALLSRPVAPSEVTRTAAGIIQRASDDPKTAGTIGKRCSSVLMGRGSQSGVFTDYHVDETTYTYRGGAYVCAEYGERGAWLLVKPEFTGYDADNQPVSVRTAAAPKNAPCPCGSGKRYRNCHRRRDNYRADSIKTSTYGKFLQMPTTDVTLSTVFGPPRGSGAGGLTGAGPVPDLRQARLARVALSPPQDLT
jgi:hypothetical protein